MCLSKINSILDKPSDLIVDGRKVFSGTAQSLKFENMGGVVDMDVWLQASTSVAKELTASDGKTYKVGFHVYADESEAKRITPRTRRVYMRRITCVGDQDGKECLIAQEMYVPSDPDAWPPLLPPSQPSTSPAKKGLINRIKGTS